MKMQVLYFIFSFRYAGDKTSEIRYCHILNKVLPPEIRCLAWVPVHTDFSARLVILSHSEQGPIT